MKTFIQDCSWSYFGTSTSTPPRRWAVTLICKCASVDLVVPFHHRIMLHTTRAQHCFLSHETDSFMSSQILCLFSSDSSTLSQHYAQYAASLHRVFLPFGVNPSCLRRCQHLMVLFNYAIFAMDRGFGRIQSFNSKMWTGKTGTTLQSSTVTHVQVGKTSLTLMVYGPLSV